MILIDSNLLVYAHRGRVPEHARAKRAIERALGTGRGVGVAPSTIAEFWSVVTHPAAPKPSKPSEAHGFMTALRKAGLSLWDAAPGFGERLAALVLAMGVKGPRVFDLQIALTGADNGATEVWTHDSGFIAPAGIAVIDPI